MGSQAVQVDAESATDGSSDLGSVRWHGAEYRVLQMHLHFPAEHAIDGQLADGELHVVHQKVGAENLDDLLVIGFMFNVEEASKGDALLAQLGLPTGASSSAEFNIAGGLDLAASLAQPLAGDFYSYQGSLTTPPCSETVQWVVTTTALKCSRAQVDAFKAMTADPGNNRPLQRMYGRKVYRNYWAEPGASLLFKGSARMVAGSKALLLLAVLLGFWRM